MLILAFIATLFVTISIAAAALLASDRDERHTVRNRIRK